MACSDAPAAIIRIMNSQKMRCRNSLPSGTRSSSATSTASGTFANRNVFSSGTMAHSAQSTRQLLTPSVEKNSVDSSTTPM